MRSARSASRFALVLGFAAGFALPTLGCQKKTVPPGAAIPPRLVEVRVVTHPPAADDTASGAEQADQRAVDVERLTARATERFRVAGVMEVATSAAPRGKSDYKLTVDVRIGEAAGDGESLMRAYVSTRLTQLGGGSDLPIANEAIAERALKPGESGNAVVARAHLERALDDVVGGLAGLARIHFGGDAALLAALDGTTGTTPNLVGPGGAAGPGGSAANEIRAEAMRVAALRKDRAAVPRLIALLRSDDGKTRDRALGALVEIGDRRAVKPITELAKFQDVVELPKVIDAMGSLGGEEARAYLEFVLSAHDDSEIKQLAQAALQRLDRRLAEAEQASAGSPSSAGSQ